jgi:hypothetical protein
MIIMVMVFLPPPSSVPVFFNASLMVVNQEGREEESKREYFPIFNFGISLLYFIIFYILFITSIHKLYFNTSRVVIILC